jgi:hypothetical protein
MKMTHGISREEDKEICEDREEGRRRRRRKRISYYYTSYKHKLKCI